MCLSVPKCVVEWEGEGDNAGEFAWVERHGRRERINMMLIGPQPVGTWVLTSLGLAKDVVGEAERGLIEDALAALAETLDGEFDPNRHFHDLDRAHD